MQLLLLDASDIGGKSLDLSGDSSNNNNNSNGLVYFLNAAFVFKSSVCKAQERGVQEEGYVWVAAFIDHLSGLSVAVHRQFKRCMQLCTFHHAFHMLHALQVVCVFCAHSFFHSFGIVFVVDAPFALASDLNLISAIHAALV